MKVKKLIEELQKMNPESEACLEVRTEEGFGSQKLITLESIETVESMRIDPYLPHDVILSP